MLHEKGIEVKSLVKRDEEGYKGRARRRFAAARGRSRPPRLNLNKAAGFLGYIKLLRSRGAIKSLTACV